MSNKIDHDVPEWVLKQAFEQKKRAETEQNFRIETRRAECRREELRQNIEKGPEESRQKRMVSEFPTFQMDILNTVLRSSTMSLSVLTLLLMLLMSLMNTTAMMPV